MTTNKPTNQANFEFVSYNENTCKQMFSDGVHEISISPATSKITFSQMVGINQMTRQERRQPTLTVVIPTFALVELCKNVLNQLQANQEQLMEGFDKQKALIFFEEKNDNT